MENLSDQNAASVQDAPKSPTVGERVAAIIKRKRGRPPGSKTGSRPDVASVPRNVAGDSSEDQKKNCAFFVETALFLFEGADDFIKRGLLDRLKRYVRDDARVREFEETIWKKNAFSEQDRERLRYLLTQLAIKYPILQKVGPEIGLAVFVVQYGVKTLNIAKAIESLKPSPNAQPAPAPKPA